MWIVLVYWTLLSSSRSEVLSPFPARQTVKGPIYVFGDVHGDIDAVRLILRRLKLIDKRDHWTGEDATAIQIGDGIGRGRYSRATTELFMRLEPEASAAGGHLSSCSETTNCCPPKAT